MLWTLFILLSSAQYKLIGSNLVITGNDAINREGVLRNSIELIETCNIEENITGIKKGSFEGCTKLRLINFPSTLSFIEGHSFRNCNSLTSLKFNSGLNSIDATYLFYSTYSLASISISENNKQFTVFDNCLYSKNFDQLFLVPSAKKSLILHPNLERISTWALYHCSVPSINAPDNLTTIENMAFVDCMEIKQLNFGSSSKLSNISKGAFWNCGFESFKLPCKVKELYENTFIGNSITSFDFHVGSTLASLNDEVFKDCKFLKTVHLPSSMKSISDNVFTGCISLETVTIDKNDNFHSSNGNLYSDSQIIFISPSTSKLEIGDNINQLPQSILQSCQNLTFVNISKNNQKFKFKEGVIYTNGYVNASYSLGGLEEITVESECICLDKSVFSGCEKLKKVKFQEGSKLLYVKEYAFSGTNNLETVEFPSCVKKFFGYVFSKSSLQSLKIPQDTEEIKHESFFGCYNLKTITFENRCPKLKNLQYFLFGRSNLTTITSLPTNLEEISERAFEYTNLSSIIIPSKIKKIAAKAFLDCGNMISVTFEGQPESLELQNNIFSNCIALQNVTLPGSLKTIPNGCFSSCKKLNKVIWNSTPRLDLIEDGAFSDTSIDIFEIPNTTTKISPGSFHGCYKLKAFLLPNSSNAFQVNEGILYNHTSEFLVAFPPGLNNASVLKGTKIIQSNAFYKAKFLESVKFDENGKLDQIGELTFAECVRLKNLEFPAALSTIGKDAFKGCTSLEKITFADNSKLTTIGESTFSGCGKLNYISFGKDSNLVSIGDKTFSGCFITTISLPSNLSYIGAEAFKDCTNLTKVDFGKTNVKLFAIQPRTFSGCRELVSIEIPRGVNSIGDSSFEGCKFSVFVMPSNISSIGKYAFYNCGKLASVTIPGTLLMKSIGEGAFRGCTSIVRVFYCGTEDVSENKILFAEAHNSMLVEVLEAYAQSKAFNRQCFKTMKHCEIFITLRFTNGESSAYGLSALVQLSNFALTTDGTSHLASYESQREVNSFVYLFTSVVLIAHVISHVEK